MHEVLNQTPVALKQLHAVRWLSLDLPVQSILNSWSALVAVLGEEAVAGNPAARGFSGKLECFSFIALTCLLSDVLPIFSKLSKIFQADNLEFDKFATQLSVTKATLETMIATANDALEHILPTVHGLISLPADEEGMIQYQGVQVKKTDHFVQPFLNQKNLFLNELLVQLENRFPEDGMKTIASLNAILNPKKMLNLPANEIPGYGTRHLADILDLFEDHPQAGIVRDRAIGDFLQFKQHAITYQRAALGPALFLQAFGEDLITEYQDIYPDFALLMKFFLTIPLNSVPCERGFSVQNFQKTKLRNRLGDQRLNDIMRVSINGPHFATFDYTDAARNFRLMRDRRM